MIWAVIIIILLVVASGALYFRERSARRELEAAQAGWRSAEERLQQALADIQELTDRGPRVVMREVAPPPTPIAEPEVPQSVIGSLGDPDALPDAPETLPDTALDAARLGWLVVRAAAVRGNLNRSQAQVRRQVTWVGALPRLSPPALLTCVAAGLPGRKYSQVGAVQACRSLQGQLADPATSALIDAAWKGAENGAPGAEAELRSLLASRVLSVVSASMKREARVRDVDPADVAADLFFVLSRLGDPRPRQHLAVGVGVGSVLRLTPDGAWAEDLTVPADDGNDGQRRSALPEAAPDVTLRRLKTVPGDVLVLSTGTAAGYLQSDDVREVVAPEWRSGPPDPLRFAWYLGIQGQGHGDDHAAVGLWEMPRPDSQQANGDTAGE